MRNHTGPPIKSANDYIAAQPAAFREQLENLREIVLTTAPKAQEVISYGVICYKYHFMLVGIGVTKDHCSFYTMSPALAKKMKSELKSISQSGGTIHFELGKALPTTMIKKIIQSRMIENELKAAAKKKR